MTWHAQLNCQRSTPPDGKSGPLNRGDSNDDRTSSSPNRSVGIYPTGQLLRLRLHLAFVKSFSEFFLRPLRSAARGPMERGPTLLAAST